NFEIAFELYGKPCSPAETLGEEHQPERVPPILGATNRCAADLHRQRIGRTARIGKSHGSTLKLNAAAPPSLQDLRARAFAGRLTLLAARRTARARQASEVDVGSHEGDAPRLQFAGLQTAPGVEADDELR